MIEKYYLQPIEESFEECLATYGDNYHRSLKEAHEHFEQNKWELGDCVLIKVTFEAVDTLLATEVRRRWL